MQVDSTRSVQTAETPKDLDQEYDWEKDEEGPNAVGQSGMKCYKCQGYGHLARNCSSEQKPKGKGKGQGDQGGGIGRIWKIRQRGKRRGKCA